MMMEKHSAPGQKSQTLSRSEYTLTKAAMASIEAQIARLPGLDKWFVDITPTACRDG
jgi:hypothetical protein